MLNQEEPRHMKKCFKILSILFIIIAICILGYYVYNLYLRYKNKVIYSNIPYINNIVGDVPNVSISVNMQKVANLKRENSEVIGWIQIDGTSINYPILQSTDNKYYLEHNYKKEETSYGSIFAKNECNILDDNSNLILYGHNMNDSQMFSELLKYEDFEFYKKHKEIKISTDEEENNYIIVAVFKSRVFYNDEINVFRYYNYINFENFNKYNDYINNCKKLQLYDTGISAEFGEKLITLITCEYSQLNGRFIVVAKKI